jgi:hypothetical protein
LIGRGFSRNHHLSMNTSIDINRVIKYYSPYSLSGIMPHGCFDCGDSELFSIRTNLWFKSSLRLSIESTLFDFLPRRISLLASTRISSTIPPQQLVSLSSQLDSSFANCIQDLCIRCMLQLSTSALRTLYTVGDQSKVLFLLPAVELDASCTVLDN